MREKLYKRSHSKRALTPTKNDHMITRPIERQKDLDYDHDANIYCNRNSAWERWYETFPIVIFAADGVEIKLSSWFYNDESRINDSNLIIQFDFRTGPAQANVKNLVHVDP